jgi:hypothetical protein
VPARRHPDRFRAAHASRYADDVGREYHGDCHPRRRSLVYLGAGARKLFRRVVGGCAPCHERGRAHDGRAAHAARRLPHPRHGDDRSLRRPQMEGGQGICPWPRKAAVDSPGAGRIPARRTIRLSELLRPAARWPVHHPGGVQFRGGLCAVAHERRGSVVALARRHAPHRHRSRLSLLVATRPRDADQ